MHPRDNLIMVYSSFLSKEECDTLIEIIDTSQKKTYTKLPSRDIYGDDTIDESSISEQEWLTFDSSDHPLLKNIESRVHNFVNESFKVDTKLDISAMVKLYDSTVMHKHYDASPTNIANIKPLPKEHEYHTTCPVITSLIYLNDCDGGQLDIEGSIIKAEAGRLVSFWGSKFKHGAEPFKGFRYNAGVWCSPL